MNQWLTENCGKLGMMRHFGKVKNGGILRFRGWNHSLHTGGVTGSIPVAPTNEINGLDNAHADPVNLAMHEPLRTRP